MFYEYKVEKLFNGFVSVRDYIVDMCVINNWDLLIVYKGKKMGIPLSWLKNPELFQIHKTKFKSKFNDNNEYELYDFFFVAGRNIREKKKI